MGVHGTFCRLCALPVQHDHYVPSVERPGMLKIFRGGSPDGGHAWEPNERRFSFGPEHAWLTQGICLPHDAPPRILRGAVSDGVFEDASTGERVMVFEGDEDGRTFHQRCWELLGSPGEAAKAPTSVGSYLWASIEPYHQQLFALLDFAQDGVGWALADPTGRSPDALRSRARIEEMLAEARRIHALGPASPPATLNEVRAQDRGWEARRFDDGKHRELIRFRADLRPELKLSGYPEMVCFIKEYVAEVKNQPGAQARADFEALGVRVKEIAERDGAAILVACTLGGMQAQGQFYLYAKDEAEMRARLSALPIFDAARPFEFDDARDPEWKIFFEDVRPAR